MKRRAFIIKSMAAASASLAAPTLFASCSHALAGKKLTILHTNDMHSHIDPFENGRHKGLGGMAARAATVKKIRAEESNVLLLDAGDVFQGTPYFNLYRGELELKLMSAMGYDATTIGNHEFDNGLEGLQYGMQYAEFPYLCANYDLSRTLLKGATKPYQVYDKAGIKVGIFGLGIKLQGLVNPKMFGQTEYLDPIATAKEMVQELKNQQCNLIICLSHLGYDYANPDIVSDKVLAQNVSGIDLILGGHTHTFLDSPTQLLNSEGYTATINQVGWGGVKLGRIDVSFGQSEKTATLVGHESIAVKQHRA